MEGRKVEQRVPMVLLRILLQKGLSDRAIEGKTESKVAFCVRWEKCQELDKGNDSSGGKFGDVGEGLQN